MSEYGVFSSPYFPIFGLEKTPYLDTAFSPNKGKYGSAEKKPYLDTFHTV